MKFLNIFGLLLLLQLTIVFQQVQAKKIETSKIVKQIRTHENNLNYARNQQFYKAAGIIEAWGWDEFKDWCKDSYNKTKEWAKDTYEEGKDWAKGEQKNIKQAQFYKAAGIIEAWGWDEFKDWCKDSYNKTKEWAKDTYEEGKDWAKGEQKIIKQARSQQFYKAAGIIEAWGWDEFKDWCKDSYNKTKEWAKDTYEEGKDWAKGEQKNIKQAQFYKAAGIIEAWGWDEFKDWCKDSYNKTKEWAKDTYEEGKDWAKGEQKNIKQAQFYKAAGIIEAWGWDEFKDWCKDSYNKTKEWAKDTYEEGKDWAKGEQKIIKQARSQQFYKAAGIIEAWGWDEFKDWCKDSYNKTKEWAKDTYEEGKDWAKGEQKIIKQARSQQFYKAAGIIEAWGWDEFKDWCKDSYNKTKEWAKDTYEEGKDWAKGEQKIIKQARSQQFYKAAGIIEAWGWDEFKDWCKDSYNKTKEWAKDTYEEGKDWAKGEQKIIKQARSQQFYKAAGIIEAWGWDEFKDWCKDSYNKTKEWAKDTYEEGKDWAKGEQKIIKQARSQQFYKAAGIIEAWGWDEFKDWCKDSYNKTKEWAKDTYEEGKDWAKGEQKNIKQAQFYKAAGIVEAWGWDEFKDWCKDSYNKTKEWAKDTYEEGKDWAKGNQKAQKLVSRKTIQTFDVNNLTSEEIDELEDALNQITPFLTEAFDNGPENYGLVKEQVLSEIQEVYGEEGVQVVHFLFEKFEVQYISQKIEENRYLFELAFILEGKEELEAIEQEYLKLLTPILEPAALEEIEKFFDSIYATQTLLSKGILQDSDDADADAALDGFDEDLSEDFDSVDQDSETEEETTDEEQQNDETELSSQQVLFLKEKSSGNFTILGIQMLKPSVEMQTLPWFNYLIFALALAFIIFGIYKCFVAGKNIANNQSVSKRYKLFKKETEIEEHFL